jgi:hydrogenase-4 membrane subunit HyfE
MIIKRMSSLLFTLVVVLCAFSTTALSGNLPETKPDNGLVIFYRISRMKGAAMRFEIRDSAKGSIGFLSNGTIIENEIKLLRELLGS